MTTLKLKVYMEEDDRRIENFSQDQWNEMCIIFQKLVRNIKEEFDNLVIEDYDESQIPYITMKVDVKEDTEFSDDDLVYVFDYLSGKNTENPVYLPDGEHLINSEIVQEEDRDASHKDLLERFNQLAMDVGVE